MDVDEACAHLSTICAARLSQTTKSLQQCAGSFKIMKEILICRQD